MDRQCYLVPYWSPERTNLGFYGASEDDRTQDEDREAVDVLLRPKSD